jgi:hypothetical protein
VVRLRWSDSIWDRIQRVVLWVLGAAGIVNELFLRPTPRPVTYPLIAMLLGLPFAQAFDRARTSRSQGDPGARP